MADQKISAMAAAASAIGTSEIPINEGGINKKLTVAVLHDTPSFTGDVSISGSLEVGSLTTPYNQTVTVAKTGGDFDTIQAAIDSITVTGTDIYAVQIYPGIYEENVILKAGVNLIGVDGANSAIITESTGDTLTIPVGTGESRSFVQNLTIKSTPSGINTAKAVVSNGYLNRFDKVVFDIDIENGYMDCIELNSGTTLFDDCSFLYTSTGTGVGEHVFITSNSTATFNITNGFVSSTLEEITTGTYLRFIEDNSTNFPVNSVSNFTASMTAETGFDGHMDFYELITGAGTANQVKDCQIVLFAVSGGANSLGSIYHIDSGDGSASLSSSHNSVRVSGFTKNYFAEIGTLDSLNSHFDEVTAANEVTGDTTNYSFINSPSVGDVKFSGALTFPYDTYDKIYDYNLLYKPSHGHTLKYKADTDANLQLAPAAWGGTEVPIYANVWADDGEYLSSVNAGAATMVGSLFSFNIPETSTEMTQFKWAYNGHSKNTGYYSLDIWKDSAWVDLSGILTNTTEVESEYTFTADLADYLDGDNKIHCMARTERVADPIQLRTVYSKITVTKLKGFFDLENQSYGHDMSIDTNSPEAFKVTDGAGNTSLEINTVNRTLTANTGYFEGNFIGNKTAWFKGGHAGIGSNYAPAYVTSSNAVPDDYSCLRMLHIFEDLESTSGMRLFFQHNPSTGAGQGGYAGIGGYNVVGGTDYPAGSTVAALAFGNYEYFTAAAAGGTAGSVNLDWFGINVFGSLAATSALGKDVYGIRAQGNGINVTCVNNYGIKILANAGTVTGNSYGLYIEKPTSGTPYQQVLIGNGAGTGIWFDEAERLYSDGTNLTSAAPFLALDKIKFTQTDGNEYIDSLATGYLDYGATTAHRFNAPVSIADKALLGTPVAGTFEFDDDRMYLTNVATQRAIDRTSDVAVATVTVADTVTETTLYTALIPANSLVAGNVFKVHCDGIVTNDSGTAGDEVTLRIYVGASVTPVATLETNTRQLTDQDWHMDANATQRTIGTTGQRAVHIHLEVGDATARGDITSMVGLATIDTTANMDIKITAEWASAETENTISLLQAFTEYKN